MRRVTRWIAVGVCTAFVLGIVGEATAVSITIVNPDFEFDGINANSSSITGWTNFGISGYFTPSLDAHYPLSVRNAQGNVALVNTGGTIFQTVGVNWAAGTSYTLTLQFGQRDDFDFAGGGAALGFNSTPGSFASFMSVAEIIASVPTAGTFAQAMLTTSPSPGAIGKPITIRLRETAEIGGVQTNFDNVQLNATPIPEPGAAGLLSLGMAALIALRRHRTRRIGIPTGVPDPTGVD